jgi:hypothetical protein
MAQRYALSEIGIEAVAFRAGDDAIPAGVRFWIFLALRLALAVDLEFAVRTILEDGGGAWCRPDKRA